MTPDNHHHRHFSFKPSWIQRLFAKDDATCHSPEPVADNIDDYSPWPSLNSEDLPKSPPSKDTRERPVTGLPRQTTFKRQNSERRERLCPVEPLPHERRAVSASRHVSTSCVRRRRTKSSPPPMNTNRASAPAAAAATTETRTEENFPFMLTLKADEEPEVVPPPKYTDNVFDYQERPSRPLSRTSSQSSFDEDELDQDAERNQLYTELDTRWILNLSMHFRDKSDREKFFVTYAETPTKWRRVTVSCDYRNAEPGSLEMDLKELQSQRDKSFAIYESVRDSLPEIQFYETVTNLKLETSEGRLHVHVTEDVNETIPYPSRSMVRHILDDEDAATRPMELCEKDVAFDAHLSGFVYRVWHQDKVYIKKEIPGPDTIDEFLYEINALHSLQGSDNVIRLEAIILDDTRQLVKGLLIGYAERGAVVDILYDNKGHIPWTQREIWARQAVMGLRDIHEEGYVQGDFTLSNIVVDENNDAKIIDINRRGCPVGWEPPEIAQKIASNQRISMYIGDKSDLYQLGMTLWALAMDDDEPERHDPPLMTDVFPLEVPKWFHEIVRICLSPRPRDRLSAKELVYMFPTPNTPEVDSTREVQMPPRAHPVHRTEKQYIDPNHAVERDDIERFKQIKQQEEELLYSPQSSKDDPTYTWPISSEYDEASLASMCDGNRGRKQFTRNERPSIDEQLQRPCTFEREKMYGSDCANIVGVTPDDEFDGKQYLVRDGEYEAEEFNATQDSNAQSSHSASTALASAMIDHPSSPFRAPNWQNSQTESTPRNSNVQLPSEHDKESPDLSPHSTTLSLLQKGHSATSFQSCRSSNDTIAGCDSSIGETIMSGTTSYTHVSDGIGLRHKVSDPRMLVNAAAAAGNKSVSQPGHPTVPSLLIQDSGYDEPALHEMTKS